MMRIGHADFRIGAIARLTRQLERDDASDVTLQRQHLQIEHQSRVIGVSGGNTDWPVKIRQRIASGIGFSVGPPAYVDPRLRRFTLVVRKHF